MIILDTNHVNVLQNNKAGEHKTLTDNMKASADQELVTTVVTLEEQMRGWLAYINRSNDVATHVTPYHRLVGVVQVFSKWTVLPFNDTSADEFKQLRNQKLRIGTMDLKIASIALVESALVLSANVKDFQQVPNLDVEDWLH